MARIAVGGFQHETNCFVSVHTDLEYFASVGDRPPQRQRFVPVKTQALCDNGRPQGEHGCAVDSDTFC